MLRKGSHHQKLVGALRYLGNILLIVGHFALLWGDIATALVIKLSGGVVVMPFAVAWRLWDVIALEVLFITLDLTKLYQVLFS